MSENQLIAFIEKAQKDEEIANKLMSIREPETEKEKEEVYNQIVTIGEKYGHVFTVEDCDSAWKAKEQALVAEALDQGETDPQPKHCVVSGHECVAVCGLLK